MSEEKTKKTSDDNFNKLLDRDEIKVPQVGDNIKGMVIAASKAEVRLDIGGVFMGVVRGEELTAAGDDYGGLKPGDEVEATVVEEENENGELELSFKYASEAKAKAELDDAYNNKKIVKVKVIGANRGGLMVNFGQISGFLPVSQLSPENYPRVSGGDKTKILEKLKSFVGKELEVKAMNLDAEGRDERVIFSEKDAWGEKQKDIISKYKAGTVVEGVISAITDFGIFVNFGENLEGLIHISELAWQRIDNPAELFKTGEKIKAEIIGLEGSKIFLSAKKLLRDPWQEVENKYKIGQTVKGTILKINPFGVFIKLDEDIHGLAHVSQLGLAPGQKISDLFKAGEEKDFTITSLEPKEHRLGLAPFKEEEKKEEGERVAEEKEKAKKTKKAEDTKDKEEAKKEKKSKKKTDK